MIYNLFQQDEDDGPIKEKRKDEIEIGEINGIATKPGSDVTSLEKEWCFLEITVENIVEIGLVCQQACGY